MKQATSNDDLLRSNDLDAIAAALPASVKSRIAAQLDALELDEGPVAAIPAPTRFTGQRTHGTARSENRPASGPARTFLL